MRKAADHTSIATGIDSSWASKSWSDLPKTLDTRPDVVDVIVNGFELTRDHLESSRLATVPYYAYELQLIARKSGGPVESWDDLGKAEKKLRVGVLSGSAAAAYAKKQYGDTSRVALYESTSNILDEIQSGKLDAAVQDTPATVYFLKDRPELKVVGQPVARGFYVIYCRDGDRRLREAIDAALLEMIRDGALRKILQRYGVWNSGQDWFDGLNPTSSREEFETEETLRGWSAVWANLGLLLRAAGMTIVLSIASMPLAILTGLLVALGRLYGPSILKPMLALYVEIIRGTPLLLQLLIIFFVLPQLGILIPPVPAGILGLAINYSAYEAEIYRAGLLAIPHGQMEAALALGRRSGSWFRRSRTISLPCSKIPPSVRSSRLWSWRSSIKSWPRRLAPICSSPQSRPCCIWR